MLLYRLRDGGYLQRDFLWGVIFRDISRGGYFCMPIFFQWENKAWTLVSSHRHPVSKIGGLTKIWGPVPPAAIFESPAELFTGHLMQLVL